MEIPIRRGRGADRDAILACVRAAYAKYVPRMGKEPAPMLADYATLIAEGVVHVIADEIGVRGVVVCFPEDDHLFLENIAIDPAYQGKGFGRALMAFVEREARAAGRDEIRLYTHARMTENLAYYPKLGYEEVDRRSEDGYDRVYFRKVLR
ncbi:MAG: GNAT family N-acetyltransferase [Chloroflexota bacterium]|nr:GNAT family N-acetyltransferase [Chloroflexota bacterium]